jgi:ribonuclease HI
MTEVRTQNLHVKVESDSTYVVDERTNPSWVTSGWLSTASNRVANCGLLAEAYAVDGRVRDIGYTEHIGNPRGGDKHADRLFNAVVIFLLKMF